ncbi:hypothetical protein HLB23_07865 [Nocardia uniformis]|uniref:Uncharacterized protein n=1 Tax=Nocardia uniformis TaxID=53432 RepID=A0A849BT68_9NOCA|nr:hypothetical protein [Nocardia uniformis]
MRVVYALITATVLVFAASCGSVDGVATAPTPLPLPPVDLAQLDVGAYATQPREFGKPENFDQARAVEAVRLAQIVPLPMEIDPRLVHHSQSTSTVFIYPKRISNILGLGDDRPDLFDRGAKDFLGGVVSLGGNKPNNNGLDLANTVMLFPDEEKAADAATAIERSFFESDDEHAPVSIPKYPAARAHSKSGEQSIHSWFATGRMVVYTWMYDYAKLYLNKVDQPALVEWVEKSLDTIVPAISRFEPTPVDILMELDIDPDGMLRRTVARTEQDSWSNPPGVYDSRAALLLSGSPDEDRSTFEEFGVDRMADYGAWLYRTRDAAAATALRDEFVTTDKRFGPAEPPKNLPAARCVEYIGKKSMAVRYYCAVAYDRYVAWVDGNQLLDAQQRVSAQYAVLVNAG